MVGTGRTILELFCSMPLLEPPSQAENKYHVLGFEGTRVNIPSVPRFRTVTAAIFLRVSLCWSGVWRNLGRFFMVGFYRPWRKEKDQAGGHGSTPR